MAYPGRGKEKQTSKNGGGKKKKEKSYGIVYFFGIPEFTFIRIIIQ